MGRMYILLESNGHLRMSSWVLGPNKSLNIAFFSFCIFQLVWYIIHIHTHTYTHTRAPNWRPLSAVRWLWNDVKWKKWNVVFQGVTYLTSHKTNNLKQNILKKASKQIHLKSRIRGRTCLRPYNAKRNTVTEYWSLRESS